MLKRSTIFAIGLCSLLSLTAMGSALADQERGNRRGMGDRAQTTVPYLKTDHREDYRRHDHRPHWREHRRAHRHDRGHRGVHGHGHYRHYRRGHDHHYLRGHDHRFADGLVFGGILGYVIGNNY